MVPKFITGMKLVAPRCSHGLDVCMKETGESRIHVFIRKHACPKTMFEIGCGDSGLV